MENVSAVKRKMTVGAVQTASKDYAGMAELLFFCPYMSLYQVHDLLYLLEMIYSDSQYSA